jgi:fatty acid desaturase
MPDHRSPDVQRQRRQAKIFGPIVLLIFAPVWLPLVLIGGALYGVFAAYLYVAVWLLWCTRGANVFLVYSRSPHWQEHIENEILPRLPDSIIVLNSSDRKTWLRLSLRAQVFCTFSRLP